MKEKEIIETRSKGNARLIVLGLILLIVLGLGVYEFAFARPQYQGITDSLAKAPANVTDKSVHELLNRTPIEEKMVGENNEVKVERYAIQRGIPFMKFNYYVAYKKSDRAVGVGSATGEKVDTYYMWKFGGEPYNDGDLLERNSIVIDKENTGKMATMGGPVGGDNGKDKGKGKGDAGKLDDDESDDDKGDEGKSDEDDSDASKSDEDDSDASKGDEDDSDASKGDDDKGDDDKGEEGKGDEAKSDEAKSDEAKSDEAKSDETKSDTKNSTEEKKSDGSTEEKKDSSDG